jgi:hypothetical protein
LNQEEVCDVVKSGQVASACNIIEIGSSPLDFADSNDLHSRECTPPIMVPETENNCDPWYVFVREALDEVALFKFHIFDAFSLIERPLPS